MPITPGTPVATCDCCGRTNLDADPAPAYMLVRIRYEGPNPATYPGNAGQISMHDVPPDTLVYCTFNNCHDDAMRKHGSVQAQLASIHPGPHGNANASKHIDRPVTIN